MPGARYLASRAVLAAAVVLVAGAVGFGIWATLTRNSAAFGRQTGLAGIYSLVLAVVVAAVAMLGWAAQRQSPASPPGAGAQSTEPGRPPPVRAAHHGATYIEMSGGTINLPGREAAGNSGRVSESAGPRLAVTASARSVPTLVEERRMLIRTKVVTAAGESREIEIFDPVLASQWIRGEFWGGAHGPGDEND